MDVTLVVVRPFAGYARGDAIRTEDDIERTLAGEAALNVVRVLSPAQES